jgi:hypothetical protein
MEQILQLWARSPAPSGGAPCRFSRPVVSPRLAARSLPRSVPWDMLSRRFVGNTCLCGSGSGVYIADCSLSFQPASRPVLVPSARQSGLHACNPGEMPPFRRGSVPATARHDDLSASTSQRKPLSLPVPAGSSSCTRIPRRTAGMRPCAPTWPRACLPPRPPPGPGTPPRRCCRPCGTSAPGTGVLRRRQARPQGRAGQGRRPAEDPPTAGRRTFHRRDRRGAGGGGHAAEPDRDRRGDRR